jgi:hypothetical protein
MSDTTDLAGIMAGRGVGSGDLFGGTQTWKISETRSVASCEMTRRIFTSVGLLGSMTAGLRDRKARLFSTSETASDNFLLAAHTRQPSSLYFTIDLIAVACVAERQR